MSDEQPLEPNGDAANEPLSAPALPRALSKQLKTPAAPAPTADTSAAEAVPVTVRKHSANDSPTTKALMIVEPQPAETSSPMPSAETAPSGDSNDNEVDNANANDSSNDDEYADPKTDAAVDDIMRHESDALLDINSDDTLPPPPPLKHHRHFFRRWLGTARGRWLTFACIVAVGAGVFGVAPARYFVLNHVGVRASLSVSVTDAGTLLPLDGVSVAMDGQTATTGKDGTARLHHLYLGSQTLVLSRVAYATQTHTIVVGWGENPLGSPYNLQATGVRYVVRAVDYFSGAGVATATATESDNTQVGSDKSGVITLSLNTNGSASAPMNIGAPGYLNVPTTLKPNVTNVVTLVPDRQEVYLSKQAGKYNVYAVNADGSNVRLLLAASGLESGPMALVASPDGATAALVSVRDHITDAHGTAEQALTLIDVAAGSATAIDHADHIKLLDWNGTTLTYETTLDAAGSAPAQTTVISYNYKASTRQQLASGADFNAVLTAQDTLFYAPSSSDSKAKIGLFKVKEDGSGQQTLLSDEVIGLYRSDYKTLLVQTASAWYSYDLDGNAAPQAIAAPATPTSTSFVLSPDGSSAAAIVTVNGTPTLQVVSVTTGRVTNVAAASPLYPLRWLNNDVVVFRFNSADYGVAVVGGSAKKIANVYDANGFAAQ